jgi:hypothetical protein
MSRRRGKALGRKILEEALKAWNNIWNSIRGSMGDSVLSKRGVAGGKELAGKVFKNLLKIVPVVGAIPNAVDAMSYARKSAELCDKSPDLSAFALFGSKLNVVDGAIGIALDFAGVGIAVDVVVSLGFSGAELVFDIAFEQELAKFNADPSNYQVPDWMKAVNLTFSWATWSKGAEEVLAGLANLRQFFPWRAAQA